MAWNLDPVLLGTLLLALGLGLHLLRPASSPAFPARRRAYWLAFGAAVLAFVSPLCAMTVALFSARALHHLVIISLLAPALALAFPWRRAPVGLAFMTLTAAVWLWHLPAVYSAAWDSVAVYWLMQGALILPAWAFWSAVLSRPALGQALWLVPLVGQMGLLGALLTFAPAPFYLEHLAHAPRFGLDALQDQQLAGLIMWVPGMVPLAVLAAMFGWRALKQEVTA